MWGMCQSNLEFPGSRNFAKLGLRSRVALNFNDDCDREFTNRVFPCSMQARILWDVGAATIISERVRPRRWFYVEHADHRAYGDVVAEQADGFDKFGVAVFIFHAREQFIGKFVAVHQRTGKLH